MADRPELIDNFVNAVGATREEAAFYLEAHNGDIDTALLSYQEHHPDAGAGRSTTAATQNYDDEEDLDEIIARTTSQSNSAVSEGKRKASPGPSGRKQGGIATFGDLSRGNDNDDDDDEDDDEDSQNFFAGGEKSGVMVQGPSGKKDSNALVEDILKKAAKGPRREETEEPAPKKTYFTGIGNRLGSEGESSTQIQPQVPEPSHTPEALESVTRTLTFWRDGYSLEDGPLMSYTDPANREFLDAISNGIAPLRYLNVRPGQPVEMKVLKRMEEDYKEPPKAPPRPFEGAGNRLGGMTSSSSSTTPGSFPGGSSQATAPPPSKLVIDESKPVTRIQIRMADGTRMVARFNLTHNVNDIRGFINASGNGGSAPYSLFTNPRKDPNPLDNVLLTIEEAGLANAVVFQGP